MSKPKDNVTAIAPAALFERIVSILDQARSNVVRAVNTNMVLAYWLIGREIVEEIQRGKGRAKYGEKVVEKLSKRLTERYGKGFSVTNIWYFRQFYVAFQDRFQNPHPMGGESSKPSISSPTGRELTHPKKSSPADSESLQGFSPQLSWSHYRALMRVENVEVRDFYERETIEGGWDKRTLERQIQSFYYERILKSRKPEKMLAEGRKLPSPLSPGKNTSVSKNRTATLIWSFTIAGSGFTC